MIRALVDGVDITDEELKAEWIYYICAREFGWTQQETDQHDYPFISDLLMFHENVLRKQKEAITK